MVGSRRALDGASVLALDAVVNPCFRETNGGHAVFPTVVLGRRAGPNTFRDAGRLYVGTPPVLRRFGLDGFPPGTEVLTPATGELRFVNTGKAGEPAAPTRVAAIGRVAYESMPSSLIAPDALAAHGWTATPAGWLVEARSPLTDAQLTRARSMAAGFGLTVEARRSGENLTATRLGATAGGMLLALGVLAMTVGLIRGEGVGDLRTLAATGATSGTRRAITAATAGALGLLGAVLGIVGAYLALVAGYLDDLSPIGKVPLPELVVIIAGVPLAAAAAGWLLGGREPPAIARVALD